MTTDDIFYIITFSEVQRLDPLEREVLENLVMKMKNSYDARSPQNRAVELADPEGRRSTGKR